MAIDITRYVDFTIRWSTTFEMNMLSIQRLLEYSKLPPEGANRYVKKLDDNYQFNGGVDF